MRKTIVTASLCLTTVILISLAGSCEKYVLPKISVHPDTLLFGAAAATQSCEVSSNVKCRLSIVADDDEIQGGDVKWLSCDAMDYEGRGDAVINVSVKELEGVSFREAFVILKSESLEKRIKVIQKTQ